MKPVRLHNFLTLYQRWALAFAGTFQFVVGGLFLYMAYDSDPPLDPFSWVFAGLFCGALMVMGPVVVRQGWVLGGYRFEVTSQGLTLSIPRWVGVPRLPIRHDKLMWGDIQAIWHREERPDAPERLLNLRRRILQIYRLETTKGTFILPERHLKGVGQVMENLSGFVNVPIIEAEPVIIQPFDWLRGRYQEWKAKA